MVSAIITHRLRQWGLGPAGATFGLDGRCSARGKQNSLSPLVPHGHEWRCFLFPSERGVLSLFSLLFAFFFLGSYFSSEIL